VSRGTRWPVDDVQGGGRDLVFTGLLGALLRAAFAVEHVGAGDLVVAAAHQAQFNLVLDVFDVEGAATRTRAQQAAHHGFGQAVDGLAHAGRGRTLGAVDGQEGLHQGNSDFAGFKRNDRTVASDDLVGRIGRLARLLVGIGRTGENRSGRRQGAGRGRLHGVPFKAGGAGRKRATRHRNWTAGPW